MIFDNIRKKIILYRQPETIVIEEEDLDCEVTDEIERALWELKEDLDLPTEEVIIAVESRRELKDNGKK
jgi:hypothetical protein